MDGSGEVRSSNRSCLAHFVDAAIDRAAQHPDRAAELLEQNAAVIRRHMVILQRPARPPAHLEGLTAFDLADAAERLEAEAVRAGRHELGGG